MAVPEEIPEVLVRPPDAPPLPAVDPGIATPAVGIAPDAAPVEQADPWAQYGAPTLKPAAAQQAEHGQDPWAKYGAPATPSAVLSDVVKSGAGGIGKGVAGLAGAAGDIAEVGQQAVDYLAPPPRGIPRVKVADRLPKSSDVRKTIEGWTGPFHEPETPLGQLASDTGELIPGVIGLGGGPAAGAGAIGRISKGVADTAKFAAVPAVAGEVAEKAAPDAAKPYAKLGASVVAGLAAGKIVRPPTAERAIKNALPDYVNATHINEAGNLIDDARRAGMTLTWPEALSQVTGRPVLLDTQRMLEGSRRSAPVMEGALGGRAQQVEGVARRQMDTVAPPPHDPDVIGPQVGRAADEAGEDVRAIINAHAEPYYTASRGVRLSPAEFQRAMSLPGVPEAIRAIRADPHLATYVQGLRDDTIGVMNEVKKYLDNAARNERSPITQGANVQRAASMERSAGNVRDTAIGAETRVNPSAPNYQIALAQEEAYRAMFLEPLMQGPLGRLANKDITTKNAIEALFPKDPLSWDENKVRQAVEALVARNEPAARALVRAHLEMELEKAFNAAGRTSEAAGFAGARFAHGAVGSPVINTQRMGNLRVAVEALPNGDRIWAGLDRMFEIMQATGQRQGIGSKTSFNTQAMKDLETGSSVGNVAKTLSAPSKWLRQIGDAWGDWQLGRNLDEMARIITDPRAGPILERLAAMPPTASEGSRLVARLVAIGQGSRAATEAPKQ